MSEVQERNRLTCVLSLYHEQSGEEPEGVRSAFSSPLSVNAQSYTRRLSVQEEPVSFDMGWLQPEQAGYLLIENISRGDGAPTVVVHGSPSWLVPAGGMMLGWCLSPQSLKFSSTGGTAKIRVKITPR